MAFTFTERAATELSERITRRVAERTGTGFRDHLGPMFVGTIHAYCFRILQDHVPRYGNYDVLDEHRHAHTHPDGDKHPDQHSDEHPLDDADSDGRLRQL